MFIISIEKSYAPEAAWDFVLRGTPGLPPACPGYLHLVFYGMKQTVQVPCSLRPAFFKVNVIGEPVADIQGVEGVKSLLNPFVGLGLVIVKDRIRFKGWFILNFNIV